MTDVGARITRVVRVSDSEYKAYVDWPAIFAGSLVAAAIFFVFNAFGTAIGLSLSIPRLAEGMSAKGYAIAVGLWMVWVTISSFIAGGYVTGRLRRGVGSDEHETNVRDGVHGLVVWAVAIVIGAYLTAASVTGLTKAGAEAATTVATSPAATSAMNEARANTQADTLLRNPAQTLANPDATRSEVSRILVRSATNGSISTEDRSYLAALAASRSGIPQAEADKRVEAVATQVREADAEAKRLALAARRIGILVAFMTAASLAAAAAGAWWGASLGGRHRDENTDYAHLVRW